MDVENNNPSPAKRTGDEDTNARGQGANETKDLGRGLELEIYIMNDASN
jgi:hypothetical protein